ncbi:MAG: response regulator, partial [Saprospiraceae bacterium]|nr:response regulator [Saprospiraceae bacterium]
MTRPFLSRLFVLLFMPLPVFSQQAMVRFEQLPSEIGLTHGSINCIKQDSKGILWMGTWSGLVRYDGYKVRIFHQESGKSEGLQSDQVTSLLEDRQGRLWVGTIGAGFHRFDREKEQFVNYQFHPDEPNSLSDNDVWSLFEDSHGYIWVGTKKVLNRFDPKTNSFLRILIPSKKTERTPTDYIYSICETPDGSIWSATARGLIRVVMNGDRTYDLQHYDLDPAEKDAALDNFIYCVRPARHEPNTLWLGSKAGLKKVVFSDSNPGFIQIAAAYRAAPGAGLSNNIIPDFLETADGNLWIATYHGLNLLDTKSGQFSSFFAEAGEQYSLGNSLIRSLYQDRTGILWIGTDKGVNKLNLRHKPFQSIRFDKPGVPANSIVTDICNAGTPGCLWIGVNGGLNRVSCHPSPGRLHHYTLVPPRLADFANFITIVWRDTDGWLWIATQGAGVLRIRERDIPPGGGQLTKLEQFCKNSPKPSINDDYVMSLYDPGKDRLWMGLWDGGIESLNRKTNMIRHFQSVGAVNLTAYPNVAFVERTENGRQKLYIGTRGNGLLKCSFDDLDNALQLDRQYRFGAGQAGCLSNDKINALFRDSRERIWVCTSGGLNLLEAGGNTFRVFRQADGLPSDIIQSIQEDKNGVIWISTQNGIASLSPDNKGRMNIQAFDAFDGLQDNFFSNHCAARLPSGMLAFGGANGISIFDPADIRPDSVPPLTRISDFLLFNHSVPIGEMDNGRTVLQKSIAETREIVLNYRENVLSFEFVGLHFAEPKKNRFAYKLEGLYDDWVYTDAEKRFAHYTNLPYREYTFWVKSANGDGVWSEPVSVKVCVMPPFWLTWWAYCIYAALFAALLYGGWRLAHLRAEFRARLSLERMEREQSEEINRLKLQFFTNISHELRTPLTLIVSPLEQLLREKATDRPLVASLTRMYQNAGRLLTMISQLLDFRKSEAGLMKIRAERTNLAFFLQEIILSFKTLADEHRIELIFNPEDEETEVWIDRDQMEKVFFNLLSNAVKFTPDGGSVSLSLRENKATECAEISVADTGPGIPPEQLEKIFDPFHQGDHQPRQGVFGGTGIGLSLVKSIVELHSGRVSAGSLSGQGAVFILSLPLGTAHFKPEEITADSALPSGPRRFVLPEGPSLSAGDVPAEQTVSASSGKRCHLLIVEDNAGIRAYLRENLQGSYDITEAADGQEALEIARSTSHDLVLSDVAMPRMDGIELCRRLKSDLLTSHIPVVLLTARTSLVYKIDGLETGADDYITKPFSMQLLALRIKNLIHIRENLREKFSKSFDLSPSAVTVNSLDEDFLRRMLDAVEKHMDESEFSIDDLARTMAMSRIQLYRKLKALTGETPNSFLRSIRLKRAAQLLATHRFQVSEVAYK